MQAEPDGNSLKVRQMISVKNLFSKLREAFSPKFAFAAV